MATIQLSGEVLEEQEQTLLLLLKTGFGDPVLRVAKDQAKVGQTELTAAAKRVSHALACLGDQEGSLPIPDGPELQELYDALGDLDGLLAKEADHAS